MIRKFLAAAILVLLFLFKRRQRVWRKIKRHYALLAGSMSGGDTWSEGLRMRPVIA